MREPNSIRSYAALAAVVVQANQNDMFGGQSLNGFDYAMAEGIRKSFKKTLFNETNKALKYVQPNKILTQEEFIQKIDFDKCRYSENRDKKFVNYLAEVLHMQRTLAKNIYETTCEAVEEETHQAM